MPSTFTTNLGVEKPGSGEQSGAWGDTVNTNMDIMDRAVNGAVSLTLVGATSTLTTSDGSLSNGQNKFLRLSGTPGGTHTITVAPNDAQKIYFVTNATNQSVVISQGSGANATILAGDNAVVYCNGAGAGAAVLNVLNALAMGAVRITGGIITGITDLAIADGGTGASTAAAALTNLGLTATAAQLNFVAGVTSAIQTQIDGKTTSGTALPLVGGTMTGPLIMTSPLTTLELRETRAVLTGTTPAANLQAGTIFSLSTSGNTTFTFTNPAATGTLSQMTLVVTAGGVHTLTFPAAVRWPSGLKPDDPGNGVTNVYSFFTLDGGTIWYGFLAGGAMA